MKNQELEQKLRQAFTHAAPGLPDDLLSRCEEQKGTVIFMNEQKKRHPRGRRIAAAAGTLAAAFAAFTVLVNTCAPFACAVARVPLLAELAAAMEPSGFMSTLRDAVVHDHAQTIGQTQTIDGVTVTIEYAIIDPWQVDLLVRAENTDADCPYTQLELAADGIDYIEVFPEDENGYLRRFRLIVPDGALPEELSLHFTARPSGEYWSPDHSGEAVSFDFTVPIESKWVSPVKTVELGQWAELNGQRLWLDRLEITYSQTRLILDGGAGNTQWLSWLSARISDGEGNVYSSHPTAGLPSDESGACVVTLESVWHAAGGLELELSRAVWYDKSAPDVVVDLAAGAAEGLPGWLSLSGAELSSDGSTAYYEGRPARQDEYLCLTFDIADPDQVPTSSGSWVSPFAVVLDPMGNYVRDGSANYTEEGLVLSLSPQYPYDTVILKLGTVSSSQETFRTVLPK